MGLLDHIEAADLTREELEAFVATLDEGQFAILREEAFEEAGIAGAWAYDPVGYVTERLRESIWSKQREILESIRDNPRTAVPSCFGVGKTWLSARVVSWWLESWPVGSALAITTATSQRQVRGQLWQHIRRLHRRHSLPGRCNLTEWWVGQEQIGLGFTAREQDPEAAQGWRAPHVLVVVDEAAGIPEAIGRSLEGLMLTGHARMLAIGNPSMDEQDTWFERICSSPRWHVIRLDAWSSPNFTAEQTGLCRACPAGTRDHLMTTHLIKRADVEEVVDEYGREDPYVVAKVDAQFPEVTANITIPRGWVDEAAKPDAIVDEGTTVALGVDIASDGGDELAIARREGFTLRLVHHESGAHLANSVDVAGIILPHILDAERLAKELGHEGPVRVKVDVVGIGIGPCSVLEKWGPKGEQLHASEIVRFNAGERAKNPEQFERQRDEMWWTLRKAFEPNKLLGGRGEFRLAEGTDMRTRRQLSEPTHGTSVTGKRQIERKKSLRSRGKGSPDRAEALGMAIYEPPGKRKASLIV